MIIVCFGAETEEEGRVGFVGYFRDFVAVRAILDDELPIIFIWFYIISSSFLPFFFLFQVLLIVDAKT